MRERRRAGVRVRVRVSEREREREGMLPGRSAVRLQDAACGRERREELRGGDMIVREEDNESCRVGLMDRSAFSLLRV